MGAEPSAEPAAHLLVAEDDASLSELVSIFLTKKGFRVTRAADGNAALAALDKGDVDLCLLDVMMPGKTGFEVLEAVRARGDTTPIIMATAVAHNDQIARALEGGADDYVTKPYSLVVLAARIGLRLKSKPPKRSAPIAPNHTLDIPIEVSTEEPVEATANGAEDEAVDVDDDAIVEAADGAVGIKTPAFDERSLFSRLRAAADVFRKKPRDHLVELSAGTVLAERYELKARIGEGGFGVVFQARHLDLGHDVAIKVLRPGTSASSVESFRLEAQRASRVRHDHAVRVLDFGLEHGVAFFVMELLDGRSVEDIVLEQGALGVTRSTTIARAVLSALAAAHGQGIVHRDVKPHNIVLHKEREREIPKLLDFGIAKSMGEAEAAGVLVGSAAFIAPERLRQQPYDGRADVYSLGVVLYRMLTGALPFAYAIDDFESIARFHLHEHAPPPSTRAPSISSAVDRVVLRLMEKDPSKRPPAEDAEALVEQLVWEANLG
jgi:DNA-binding response OmpR family regulator